MKKNLFGAVAAGLALALAITSFGCESGNDDPIARPEFADLAAVKGSKFTYVATPTEYTYKAATGDLTAGTTATDTKGQIRTYDANGTVGYSYVTFINGVQNYNKATADSWGKADKSKLTVGDYIATKSETITLSAGDKTFTWETASSEYEVRELKELASAASVSKKSYEDWLPYYIVTTSADFLYDGTSDTGYTGTKALSHAAAIAVLKESVKAVTAAKNRAQKALDDAVAALAPANRVKWDALDDAGKKSTTVTELATAKAAFVALDTASTNATATSKALDQATYMAEGAKYTVLSTETKNDVITGSIKYIKSLDKAELVKEVSKASGTVKVKASGVYTISTNDYKNATITLTTYKSGDDTIVFNSDDTYTKNGLLMLNKVDVDFPKATTRVVASGTAYTGSNLQKAARVLTIAAGTLTAPRFITTYTDGTTASGASPADDHVGNNGFLLSSSYTTYERAYKDLFETANAATGTYDQAVSYSYVWK